MQKNRNICVGIVAHVDAGKTTITEQFLYKAGVKRDLGRVDHKNTMADSMSVEKNRGITVRASTVVFPWKGKTVQLLDTPGHVDFIAEVERSLSVLDVAVLAISAKEGIETQTRILYEALKRKKIPTVFFINKIDRRGVNLKQVYEGISNQLTPNGIKLQKILGEGSRDSVLVSMNEDDRLKEEMDDILTALSEEYLEKALTLEEDILQQERLKTFRKLFREGKCFPTLHGSALHGIGMDALLDTLVEGASFKEEKDLQARCYKVDRDPKENRRCFVRLYGGRMELRESYPLNGGEEAIKITQMAGLDGITPVPKHRADAGEIVVIYDNTLSVEDTLGSFSTKEDMDQKKNIASPTLIATVEYEHLGQRKEILHALDILTDEDPFLDYQIHPRTEEIQVKLFGIVQKEIVLELLKERFGIITTIKNPETLYLEKPLHASEGVMYMYRDTFLPATIGLKIIPLPEGSGFQYESAVSLGHLKKSFQRAVYDGVREGVQEGVGSRGLTDLKVIFSESEFDSVNSTPSDFRKLAPQVLKKALNNNKLVLMEPYLHYELQLPVDAIGKGVSDILRMRGTVSDPLVDRELGTVRGEIPADTCKAFGQELSGYTEGKGSFHTRFSGYKRCNPPVLRFEDKKSRNNG